jgi:Flp pilus assembly protein TadG
MKPRSGKGGRGRRGQALAEFALIMPVLFLLIAGIIEFGRGWNIKQAVTDAAREGARYTVVQDPAGATLTMTDVENKIKSRLALASIPTTNPPTTISITPAAFFKCGAGGAGEPMTVLVSTPHSMGFVGALLGWAGGSSTITISSKSTMRNEC